MLSDVLSPDVIKLFELKNENRKIMTDKNDFAIIDEKKLSNFKKIRFKPNFVFFKIIENILKLLKKIYYKIKKFD